MRARGRPGTELGAVGPRGGGSTRRKLGLPGPAGPAEDFAPPPEWVRELAEAHSLSPLDRTEAGEQPAGALGFPLSFPPRVPGSAAGEGRHGNGGWRPGGAKVGVSLPLPGLCFPVPDW